MPPTNKTKRLTVFLTGDDEQAIVGDLQRELPWLALFRDHAGSVRRVSAITDEIQLWIPTVAVPAEASTPEPGTPHLQFLRSRTRPSRLLPGKVELREGLFAIAFDPDRKDVAAFVQRVWSSVKKVCTSDVERVNPVGGARLGRERSVWLGRGAVAWWRVGNLLAGTAANVFYAPSG